MKPSELYYNKITPALKEKVRKRHSLIPNAQHRYSIKLKSLLVAIHFVCDIINIEFWESFNLSCYL